MNFKALKKQLWFNIFVRVAVIFIVFVLVLTLSNISLLVNFFVAKEKNALQNQIKVVNNLDLDNEAEILSTLSQISEEHNFDVEIYNRRGSILYTTHGGQMMDFFKQKNDRFNMAHEEMSVIKSEDLGSGITFKQVVRRFDNNEYLLCEAQIDDGIFAEVRVQKQLIVDSADIANEFIIIVSAVCFVLSIAWVLIFAKKFSEPISEMNRITKEMASLNFDERLNASGEDEIGQLSCSINELSNTLSSALEDLKAKNEKLQEDIEAERRLDSMRKAFIANVSHELKTPIAIINGYAEGLKLDINPESREEYCNTIIDEGNRMNSLVLSILELSKYESGQMPLNLTEVDMGTLANELIVRIFKNSKILTKCEIPKNTIALADSLQIEQVLKSLLENALAHTPEDGSVRVTAGGEDVIRISVFNTGSHIETDDMPQIWQSFYRGDSSHKRDKSRFGLGLSIVSAIIKMHNTRCGVYNTEDGVCFWFELNRYK